ncbi:MAG: hypothetical protein P8020_03505 [Acidobacteriota bacterium]|jgi:Ca-activated chloride channel homolog
MRIWVTRALRVLTVVILAHCSLVLAASSDGLTYLRVVVTKNFGRTVATGLKKEQFEIYEHKQRRTIQYFDDRPAPVSLAIVLDLSKSMEDFGMPEGKEALRAVNDAVPSNLGETLILSFAGGFFVHRRFGDPRLELPARGLVEALQDRSGRTTSSVIDALIIAAERMEREAHNWRRLIVLISDAQDHKSRYSARELAERFGACGARLCAVVPYPISAGAFPTIRRLVPESGGWVVHAPNFRAENLTEGVRWLLFAQANEYVLGFRPKESAGLRHRDVRVRVRVKGHHARFLVSPLKPERTATSNPG